MHLYEVMQSHITTWREAGYPCEAFPAIAEILEYATIPLEDGTAQLLTLRAGSESL